MCLLFVCKNVFAFCVDSISFGEGNGNPLQCSCLENPGGGGPRWAAFYGVAQSRTRLKWLSSSSSSKNSLCLLSGRWRKGICPAWALVMGSVAWTLLRLTFSLSRKAVCSEQPQMIIIQFILLLWFFHQSYIITQREVLLHIIMQIHL